MVKRTGGADLPLHGGRVPGWLRDRMATLGRVIVEALVLEYGRAEVLRRLAHPFWFQSLGAVMGMDWHSSGITTSVVGALRVGLSPVAEELGLFVLGGRGRASRRTPEEIAVVGERLGLDVPALVRASRLVAKVDNAAVQDGFQIYLHGFVLAEDGQWVVVQQGLSDRKGMARRYHWASEGLESFVEAPHQAIEGAPVGAPIVNLVDLRATRARDKALELSRLGPEAVTKAAYEARRAHRAQAKEALPFLQMPLHHDVRPENVVERRLNGALAAAKEAGPETFEALLLTPGLGPRTLETLAFVAEVLHGTPSRFSDPARFSLGLGGKDGHPFPVPLKIYDDTLRVLRRAIKNARLGRSEAMDALRRLDDEARRLERTEKGPGVQAYIERQRALSPDYGGRTVHGPARKRSWAKDESRVAKRDRPAGQLDLFASKDVPRRLRPLEKPRVSKGPWA